MSRASDMDRLGMTESDVATEHDYDAFRQCVECLKRDSLDSQRELSSGVCEACMEKRLCRVCDEPVGHTEDDQTCFECSDLTWLEQSQKRAEVDRA